MITFTSPKNHWPDIDSRTCRSIWFAFSAPYRADSKRWRLYDFDSRMPLTDSVSCVIAVISDRDSWVRDASRARTWPTRRCTSTRAGMSTTATSVSRQSSRIIATSDAITVTELPTMLDTNVVSTPLTPPTSFWSRDWMTPVLVRVKNARSMDCRRSNSRVRRSPVTLLPTEAVT